MTTFLRSRAFFVVALLSACSERSVAGTEHAIFGVLGTRNIYRGYDAWVEISHGWLNASQFSVDPATDLLTVTGSPLANNTYVRLVGTAGLPSPLNVHASYTTCDLEGNRFRLVDYGYSCASGKRLNFSQPGSGVMTIGTPARVPNDVHVTEVTGVPAGVTYEIWCEIGPCRSSAGGKFTSSWGASKIQFRFRASSTARLGLSTIRVKLETNGYPARTVNIPLKINNLLPVRLSKPSSFPPVPGKAKWESTMTTLGARWCKLGVTPPIGPMSYGYEAQVWYYDGAWVYFQTADYTRNAAWEECGFNLIKQYRDYVLGANGRTAGWRAFTDGLEFAARNTSDPSYALAVDKMVQNGTLSLTGGGIGDNLIRETAYYLETQLTNERLTGKQSKHRQKSVDLLLGMFDSLFVSDTYIYQQIFWDGLALRALIRYYEMTGDPRIPVAVKTALDWIWTRAWSSTAKALMISPDLPGPRCEWGCQQFDTGLINLVAPAFAWYWSITGNSTYLQRGDEFFQHSLDVPIDWSGKIFSQNYRWSFDYVKWRQLESPGIR